MFFPKAMSEVELVVPSKDLLGVMKVLAGHGVFHQADSTYSGPATEVGFPGSWQERASAYAALERRVQVLMLTLGINGEKSQSTDFQDVADVGTITPTLERIEAEVKQTSDGLADAKRRLEQLVSSEHQLEPVADLDLDISAIHNSHYLYSVLGLLPTANLDRLQTSLARVPHMFLTLRSDPRNCVVWLAGTQSNADVLDRAARSAYLNPLDLPENYKGTPAEITKALRDETVGVEQKISELGSALARLGESHRQQLSAWSWELHASRMLAEAVLRFGRLRHTYIIVGWVPTDDLEDLARRLRLASREILIETNSTRRHGENQNVPVALRHSKFLRPFELLVTTYARPRYGELDPTWLIALTYPLLFGAMFGDVGHGLLLAALGALVSSRKVRFLNSLASLGGLISICGLVAAAFGFLYGSVFGFEELLPAIWLHPSKDPLRILAVAVGAGVALLTVGFLVGIYNAFLSRDWGHMLFGHNGIAGFVLYWSLLGLAATTLGKLPVTPVVFAVLGILTGLAIMFSEVLINLVDGVRPVVEGGLGTYAIQAPMELFETVISFLSNSLSYVRVGAFAIAHVVLSSVVFLLAGLVGSHNAVAYWIVVAIGNVFIVGYEGLIVGIQAMRLSYYEFFGKFFTGGGMRFEPLALTPAKED